MGRLTDLKMIGMKAEVVTVHTVPEAGGVGFRWALKRSSKVTRAGERGMEVASVGRKGPGKVMSRQSRFRVR